MSLQPKITICISALLICSIVYSQQSVRMPAEADLQRVIQRSYAACVRVCGFDTVQKRQNSAQFSGVVVSKDGTILTVAHAIRSNSTYLVNFPDGKTCLALGLGKIALAGTRSMPDVACIKILDKGDWPFAEMGYSHTLTTGDPCIGMSYPESLSQTFPTIRYGTVTDPKEPSGFIQTSCAMEVGDSGGPVFDLSGKVIGLNSRCAISEDENYVVPVDLFRKYRTALTQPVEYDKWPAEDRVDSSYEKPVGVRNIMHTSNAGFNFSENCVAVSSMVDGREMLITGTIIDVGQGLNSLGLEGTFIISKSSYIGLRPIVEPGKGKKMEAEVILRSREYDLALLHVSEKLGAGIDLSLWDKETALPSIGSFLFSGIPEGTCKIGVSGSAVFPLPAKFSCGYLGSAAGLKNDTVFFRNIHANSPAAAAGLKEGDQLLRINGVVITSPLHYSTEVQKYWPGDTVMVQIRRDTYVLEHKIILAKKPERVSNHTAEKFPGGKSTRRDGFAGVFVNDARIKASECGGPVFDKSGNFKGINIARFSRTATIVLPARILFTWLQNQHSTKAVINSISK